MMAHRKVCTTCPPGTRPDSKYTFRLTFSATKGSIQLLSGKKVQMIAPPSHAIPAVEDARKQGGYRVEVQDAKGTTLYRRAITTELEGREYPADELYMNTRAARAETAEFTLLIPALSNAHAVVLYGPKDEAAAKKQEPAQELARFSVGTLTSKQKDI